MMILFFFYFFLKLSVDSAAWKAPYIQMEQGNCFIELSMPLSSHLAFFSIYVTGW